VIGEEPEDIALTILKKNKKGSPDEEDEDMEDEGSSGMGPDALKGMYSAMKSGDYQTAFDALRSAIECCKDE